MSARSCRRFNERTSWSSFIFRHPGRGGAHGRVAKVSRGERIGRERGVGDRARRAVGAGSPIGRHCSPVTSAIHPASAILVRSDGKDSEDCVTAICEFAAKKIPHVTHAGPLVVMPRDYLPALASWLSTDENVLTSWPPNVFTTAMMATEMPAAIRRTSKAASDHATRETGA